MPFRLLLSTALRSSRQLSTSTTKMMPKDAYKHLRGTTISGDCNLPNAKMRTPIPDYLAQVITQCGIDNPGATADYIPELRDANPDRAALCVSTTDGFVYGVGDADVEFSIQSISKAFVYALALEEKGVEAVLKRVGVEPSGEAFNELSLETDTRRPLNPMINAGAITTHTLIGPEDASHEERFERIRAGLSKFAGRELGVDEEVYTSELQTAYRNTAISNMLRNYGIVTMDPNDVVKGYTRQCSVNVTTRDLAIMAATLANGGIQPVTGERVVRPEVVRQVLSVMMTCGMYNGAGDWLTTIGIPAKSGVAGDIIGALPGQVGIATFSPRLDSHGNSVRGVRMCKRLSDDMGLHIMHASEPARSVVRRHYLLQAPKDHPRYPHTAGVLSLQGTISFASAERVLRVMSLRSATSEVDVDAVVLDIRQVYTCDQVSKRMLREAIKRLRKTGFECTVVDPEHLLDMLPPSMTDDVDYQADHVADDLSFYKGWDRVATPSSMLT